MLVQRERRLGSAPKERSWRANPAAVSASPEEHRRSTGTVRPGRDLTLESTPFAVYEWNSRAVDDCSESLRTFQLLLSNKSFIVTDMWNDSLKSQPDKDCVLFN